MGYNYIYFGQCPKCGAEVLRHDTLRYRFCPNEDCDIYLRISSFRESAGEITMACYRERELTRARRDRLVQKILRRYDEMAKFRTDLCPNCGKQEFDREIGTDLMDHNDVCGICNVELKIPGDSSKPIGMYKSRSDNEPWKPIFCKKKGVAAYC